MAGNYFIWKGITSTAMGVVVQQFPTPDLPKERVKTYTIPGRSGVLTIPESDDAGEPVLENHLLSCKCFTQPGADLQKIFRWLRGSGEIVFANDLSHRRKARITNAIPFSEVMAGRDRRARRLNGCGYMTFTIPFDCEPYLLQNPEPEAFIHFPIAAGADYTEKTIHNPGDIRIPLKCVLGGTGTLGIGVFDDKGFIVAYVEGVTGRVQVDFDTCEAYYLDDNH